MGMINLHGTQDGVVPYNGGEYYGSTQDVVDWWVSITMALPQHQKWQLKNQAESPLSSMSIRRVKMVYRLNIISSLAVTTCGLKSNPSTDAAPLGAYCPSLGDYVSQLED